MNWIYFAVTAPFLWAVNNHIDKHLLVKYYNHVRPATVMILSGLSSAIFSLLILIFDPSAVHLPLPSIAIMLIA